MKRSVLIVPFLIGILASTAPALTPARKARRSTPVRKHKARPGPRIDPTLGDNVDGEDLIIRRTAVAALGSANGSVVVVDPTTGRILTIVNQKLALKSGFTPCSTIKLVTSMAALNEHVIDPDTTVSITRRMRFNLTTALARSNNQYFARLGNTLGFERVTHYAQLLGLGEKAALDIPKEEPGLIPTEPPKIGGVGLMTTFGEGFLVTPLELAALVSAIANNGTLYYLQYPRTEAEIDQFTPKVKRTLDLPDSRLPDIRMGMKAAVDFGTARRIGLDMHSKLTKARKAAAALLHNANRKDEFSLVEFNDFARLAVSFTTNVDEIMNRLAVVQTEGGTALLDAVRVALNEMKNAHHNRKAIVIVSDGEDNASHCSIRDLRDAVREADVLVYAIGIVEGEVYAQTWPPQTLIGSALLNEIARQSSGRFFQVSGSKELPQIASKIDTWLRNQYTLAYAPNSQQKSSRYHRIEVRITRPEGFPRLRAYWRLGYYTPATATE